MGCRKVCWGLVVLLFLRMVFRSLLVLVACFDFCLVVIVRFVMVVLLFVDWLDCACVLHFGLGLL